MTVGTLVFKVSEIEGLQALQPDQSPSKATLTVAIGSSSRDEKLNEKLSTVEPLNFDVDTASKERVNIKLKVGGKKKSTYEGSYTIADLTAEKKLVLTGSKGNVTLVVDNEFMPKDATQKYTGEETSRSAAAVSAVSSVNMSQAVAVAPTHRPWFSRVTYYYDTSKYVYAYTTSIRGVARLARMGEDSANYVLQRLSGKSLNELDQGVLVPVLHTVDDKVDETITLVLTKLFEGQNFLLKKKDDVMQTATTAASTSAAYVAQTKDTVMEKASDVVHKSSQTVSSAIGASVNTVVLAKDYTTSQLSSVSSSAYGTVRGVAVTVLSHVPLIGSKIRAA